MKKYDLSVIVPAYNHSLFIEECLLSILNNSKRYVVQLVVIDDFSSDGTALVIKKLLHQFDFEFYQNDRNLGLNQTLEIGLKKAKARHVSILASDDLFLAGRIDAQLDCLLKGGLDGCYSKSIFYDHTSSIVGKSDLYLFQSKLRKSQHDAFKFVAVDDTNGPLLQSGTFKTSVLRSLSELRKKYKSDDWVILLAMLKDYKIGFVDAHHLGYRLHSTNSHSDYIKMFHYRLDVIANYVAPISSKLALISLSNLFFSHSRGLFINKRYFLGIRFLVASFLLHFPGSKILNIFKRYVNE